MPEVVVRKRLGRRSGDVRYRSKRWFYRHRPRIAVTVAFLAAALLGLVIASGSLKSLNASHPDPEAAAPISE